jgi:hypothetical protein
VNNDGYPLVARNEPEAGRNVIQIHDDLKLHP